MKFGYARVSTLEQDLSRQIDQLKAEGCERIYEEKITGTKKNRPQLSRLLDNLREGDTVIITELTRLSRSTKDLFELVDAIENKGVNIKSLKEIWLDTTTPHGKLLFTMFAGISQFERDLISERTKEGLASAKKKGRIGGRPKIKDEQLYAAISLYKSGDISVSEITKITNVSKTTLYRHLKND